MNVKQLIIEAYESDKLRLVLSFVCRIIKESKGSTVFKPSNPWLSSILGLLKEIYAYPDSDRFQHDLYQEIESTFIHLNTNIRDFPTSGVLRAIQSNNF